MYYLIIQLFRVEYKEDVLLALTSCGIKKVNLFDGQNMDKTLHGDIPLFSGFLKSPDEKERYSVLIMAAVKKKEKAKEVIHLLKEAGIEIQKRDILRLVLLPVELLIDNEIEWEKSNDSNDESK